MQCPQRVASGLGRSTGGHMVAWARGPLYRLSALPPQRCGCRPVFSAAILQQLAAVTARHAELSAQLTAGAVEVKQLSRLSRELNRLEKIVPPISRYQRLQAEAADLRTLVAETERGGRRSGGAEADSEMADMAAAELAELQPALDAMENDLKRLLVPVDEADSRDAIVELRAGTGGDEAALFAADLMAMYEAYCGARGWAWAPIAVSRTDTDGVKEASIGVSGAGAFGALRYEVGVHRVQRVPATEGAGRVHTSTASVAVLPEAEEVDVDIKPSDLRIDTFRAQGAGGQHVNTTDSAVRITHVPTGVVVQCQDERSQQQNRVRALRVLRARIFEAERERLEAARAADRRAQIGRGERSERVRTYNFTQNRVTDHRVNITKHDIASFMRGESLGEVISALEAAATDEKLASLE